MRESSTLTNSSLTPDSSENRFYHTVWRWHFYAGLFVIPFMLILATTGIIYLFKPQLDAVMYPHLLFVQPNTTLLPYTQQLAAVQQAYPDATVTQFFPNIAADRTAEVALTTTDERTLMAFVDPYTGQVLGDRDETNNLQAIARRIHGELMLGQWGDYLVELAACWGLVLLISGVYLWFPRRHFSLLGTFIPRWWSNHQRIFWRDLHAVSGIYGVLLISFLILTGLPWSGFWGETFAQVWSRFPAQMWEDVPQSTELTGSLNQRGDHIVPWAVEQLPMPASREHAEHGAHSHNTSTDRAIAIPAGERVNLDSVITLAQAEGAPPGFSVSLPDSKTGVYTVSAFPNNPTQEMTLHIDQYSGKVLADVRWQDYGWVPRAVEMGIAIHMGKFFGLGNQLLMLFACLLVIVLCMTGTVMWWQRRPKAAGWLGAPTLPPHVQSWRVPLAIAAILGLVFPLVGFSLVAVLLLDYGVLSRIPFLKRVFS
ncbi:MAG: PepSY domain-containing protein [Oculatellaceae cyanobacterium bins.114]|nr:PepSY domain-containing protein [Oculatellaceae cyanobacterium bins.114]